MKSFSEFMNESPNNGKVLRNVDTSAQIKGSNNIVLQDISNSHIAIINVKPIKEQFNITKEILTQLIPFENALKMLLEFRETTGKQKKSKTKENISKPSLLYGFSIRINRNIGEEVNTFQNYKFNSGEYLKKVIDSENNYLDKFLKANPNLDLVQSSKEESIPEIKEETIETIVESNNQDENQNQNQPQSQENEEQIPQEQIENSDAKIKEEFEEYKNKIEKELEYIKSLIQIRIKHLTSIFLQVIYSIRHQNDLLENMLTRIGHREYKDEANMHLKVVNELTKDFTKIVDGQNMTEPEFDILTPQGIGIIGIMIDLERRRIVVEKIVSLDKTRKDWTTYTVIFYIVIVLVLLVISQINNYFDMIIPPIKNEQLFWATISWSLIGSFASMVYQFNKNPIHDFGNAVKWLLTRPVQGIALGAALYLVMIVGEYVFTGDLVKESVSKSERILLLLGFLLGFSDKVGDSIFNNLIKKYSSNNIT